MSFNVVKYGTKRERRNYSKVKSNVDLPDLIKVQTESFDWSVQKGLAELFRDISPIQNFTENIELYFEDYEFDFPKYNVAQAKEKDMTFSKPLRVNVKLVNKETGEIKQQKIFMGDFPIMSDTGSFISSTLVAFILLFVSVFLVSFSGSFLDLLDFSPSSVYPSFSK